MGKLTELVRGVERYASRVEAFLNVYRTARDLFATDADGRLVLGSAESEAYRAAALDTIARMLATLDAAPHVPGRSKAARETLADLEHQWDVLRRALIRRGLVLHKENK